MYSFCPHCGKTLEQDQVEGKMLTCIHCGKPIGVVPKNESTAAVEAATAARCPVCQQAVEVKPANSRRTFVPHYAAGKKKICPGSGKGV